MMHKAWSSIEEVSHCFSRSSIKFQGHVAKKIDFYPNWAFPDCNSSLIHQWLWNDAQSSIEKFPYFFLKSFIKFEGHADWKIDDLNPIWVRFLGRLHLSNPSDLPCWSQSMICMIKEAVIWYFLSNKLFWTVKISLEILYDGRSRLWIWYKMATILPTEFSASFLVRKLWNFN